MMHRRYDHGGVIGGVVLILLGIAFLLDQFFDVDILKFWPVALIVAGIVIVKEGFENKK